MTDKKEKSKINLETIVKEGSSLMINEMAYNESDISKKIPLWIQQYVEQNYGKEQAEAMYETLRRDPLTITPLISQVKTEHENNLITEVKKDSKAVAKATDPNYTIGLASKFFGDTNYKTLKETIENNGDVKTAFSNTFKGDLWKYTVSMATPEAVKGAANGYIQRITQKEIAKNLCNEKGEFDINKASVYLTNNIKMQKEDVQNTSYKELGLAYTQTTMSKD